MIYSTYVQLPDHNLLKYNSCNNTEIELHANWKGTLK